ncbi:PD-(D/E)XK nuclease family protein [Aminobacter ciceronei]|uniref:PD-(D/E)XK nuclease superfamily protein n=1 Tax=Aminobacter ciceronei TaxID=150723 RepID=A0ABR6C8B5_9HYPH|nr:PD-(D/E)XK nuclease family protein [Aminobacter ciceronei]MBA8907488.1 hypothetical protein [Aminobacter ciceronei]MBA9021250.1 hypothetical protein [Aminobacter ciceronei]
MNPQPTPEILPRLYERDIDVLLQEELLFNSGVQNLFTRALDLYGFVRFVDCRLSVFDQSGETDVLTAIEMDGQKGVLLIENKIDASFQPRQAERYRERTQALESSHGFARCVLVAPESYVGSLNPSVSAFDASVSYEEIAAAIEQEGTSRALHRASLIKRAIERARSSYILVEAPAVTSLWERIYRIASSEFPALEMKPPSGKGSNSSWVIFKGALPPKVTIDWKIKKATVDLSFWPGASARAIEDAELTPDARTKLRNAVLRTLGSTRVLTMPVSHAPSDFSRITDEGIREALTAATLLLNFLLQREAKVTATGR